MKHKTAAILISVMLAVCAYGETPAQAYAGLERHLQSLNTLEIRYIAVQPEVSDEPVDGHIIWESPDGFYHDTPEWTTCENGDIQWRYLKRQNTLILENSDRKNSLKPENILFDFRDEFHPVDLTIVDENRHLRLERNDAELDAEAVLIFAGDSDRIRELRVSSNDEPATVYRFTAWEENVEPDSGLFVPPEVPAENLIDFRLPGKKTDE